MRGRVACADGLEIGAPLTPPYSVQLPS
jgi:hypothetical protein